MSLDDFLDMTPDEYIQAYNCMVEHRRKSDRDMLELMRLIAYGHVAPHLKKPRPTIEKFWPFEWDAPQPDSKPYDRKEGEKQFAKLKEQWRD